MDKIERNSVELLEIRALLDKIQKGNDETENMLFRAKEKLRNATKELKKICQMTQEEDAACSSAFLDKSLQEILGSSTSEGESSEEPDEGLKTNDEPDSKLMMKPVVVLKRLTESEISSSMGRGIKRTRKLGKNESPSHPKYKKVRKNAA